MVGRSLDKSERGLRGRLRGASVPLALVWATAVVTGLMLAVAINVLPQPLALFPVAALGAVVVVFGFEVLIALAVLGGVELLPFIDTSAFVIGRIPVWLFMFTVASALMLVAWGWRVLARRPRRPIEPNLLLILIAVYLVYTVIRLGASQPLTVPSLAAPFVTLPLAALIIYLWLSHDDALRGLRRALPVVLVLLAIWAAAYIAGSAGCGICRAYVVTSQSNQGLLGPESRLYTAGQNSFLALALVAFGQMLRRFSPGMTMLTTLAFGAIALQASRAQYFALLAGAFVLLIWKFGRVRIVGRLLLVSGTVVGLLGLLSTPAGERGLSGIDDLTRQSGTAGFRFRILDESIANWSFFGAGVDRRLLGNGINFDLGFPNTLIVLGYLGGFLQILVLVVALVRSASARTLTGATLAAIFALVLVARPTLPLIEYGHSSIFYGAALAFAAALHTRARAPAPP